MKKQIKFDKDNPLCVECWGEFVWSQCKGEVDGFEKCEDFVEGCTECLEEFCEEGSEERLCLRLKKSTK